MDATGKRMMGYLPPYWHENAEMQQIMQTDGAEVTTLNTQAKCIYTDAFIMQASESRISEWEKWLGLPPEGTLDDRRRKILSYFQTIVKLNENVIKSLASMLYRGARVKVRFLDSEIQIEFIPLPENYLDTDASLLAEQIEPKRPLHIGLSITRYQCMWGDIDRSFPSWGQAKALRPTWYDIKLHIPDYIE